MARTEAAAAPSAAAAKAAAATSSYMPKLSQRGYDENLAAALAAAASSSKIYTNSKSNDSAGPSASAATSRDQDAEEVDEIAGPSADNINDTPAEADRDDSQTAAATMAAMSAIQAQQRDLEQQSGGSPPPPFSSTSGNGFASGSVRTKRGPENERERKDQHKEVERRRRMHINEGLSRLSQMLPNCDAKGLPKGQVILSAIDYIEDLKNNEASNIEKWTLEKLLMDQHSQDLETRLEASKRECESLRRKLEEISGEAGAEEGSARKRARA